LETKRLNIVTGIIGVILQTCTEATTPSKFHIRAILASRLRQCQDVRNRHVVAHFDSLVSCRIQMAFNLSRQEFSFSK
jgi:hypothetical protein